jgi:hypothetical protein
VRARTRNVIVGTALVLVLLLAFVAGVGLLKSGDPYYLTATPVAEDGTDGPGTPTDDAVNGTDLPTRRFPFTTAAISAAARDAGDAGRSEPYWEGPIGVKEFFTHSPFDELESLRQRNPGAAVDDGVLVRRGNVTYRVGIVREGTDS